jgi:hypothetical protein
MPDLATVLKDEITRLARKQQRPEADALRKTVNIQRSEIASLKRRFLVLERALAGLSSARRAPAPKPSASASASEEGRHIRFTPSGLASNRQRLGLSAADYGLLVGASGQSIYAWEPGTTTPRPKHLAAIASLRGIGTKAAVARLSAIAK